MCGVWYVGYCVFVVVMKGEVGVWLLGGCVV